MQPTSDDRVPVLITGGSLVGLSTSLFLGRLGVDHLLVEKHAATSHHPRGRGNNVRTMELFRTAGIEPAIRSAASVLSRNHGILQAESLTGDNQRWLFREIDPGGGLAAFSPSGWCLCSQNDLEPVLLKEARALGGDIRFGVELRSFEQDSDGVTAELLYRETGETRTVRAGYLVAADGPRSPVRERLGIGQTGAGELFHNVSVTFRAKRLAEVVGDRHFIACYLTNPDADGALLPVDNEAEWVFHLPWHPERGEQLDAFTDERCAAHIRTAVGVPGLEVEITGKAPWHAAERVAERYSQGRVLLAGDSAHEMSPTGAFGSNTGIQDAHNLAWKLAAVLGGWAGPGLLETYGAERRPVAVATSARASERSAEHSHPGYDAAPAGGNRQSGVLTVALGYRYPAGAVVGVDPDRPVVPTPPPGPGGTGGPVVPTVPDRDGAPAAPQPGGPAVPVHPEARPAGRPPAGRGPRLWVGEPGTRAPHMWVTREGEKVSTLDLYERVPVLLTRAGSTAGAAWHSAAARVGDDLGVPLERYRVGAGQDADLVTEPGEDFSAAHGTGEDGALLVRPDGFVAWRATAGCADPAAELSAVLRQVLSLD
ncbi:FAD-dependent oxidoreductase [Actinacidiphila bryophytorum]|uniref:Polyketide hydroxylase n=1 Tax=Actinacidiphila bryophytorum TaxID=1436133 RepID=A0A9W4EDE3_9ACTN|nr:FAD-dependent monooxygenase [Actinacidiphila bryophytorum]CAG7621301.1 Putative polyketide hydroxylase [Actinacidiphila bryophytorum]